MDEAFADWFDEAAQAGWPDAADFLAELRAEGFDVYRPVCSECDSPLHRCFQAAIKCCPDCAHFADRLVPAERGEQ